MARQDALGALHYDTPHVGNIKRNVFVATLYIETGRVAKFNGLI